MATNAYLERMNQLSQERVTSNKQTLSQISGLPIQRPDSQHQAGSPSGVPTGQSPIPEEDESYKQTPFYTNFEGFKQSDPQFGGMVESLTSLATGLRQQVSQGFMPSQIAEQRIKQYINDTSEHFKRTAPEREKAQQNQQMMQMVGALTQEQPQAPQEIPPEGVSAQEAMQQGGM